MDDVKLPDLTKLDAVKKRLGKLPPQESATDTSNWEKRSIAVTVVDVKKKKTILRNFDFLRTKEDLDSLTLAQIRKIEEKRSKKASK